MDFLEAVRVAREIQQAKSEYTQLPKIFVVPSDEPWPQHLQGLTLYTSNIRSYFKTKRIDQVILNELNQLNFVWDEQAHQRHLNLIALKTYLSQHGNLLVPQLYVVPDSNSLWPKDTWKLPLGSIVRTIQSSWSTLSTDYREALVKLDFPSPQTSVGNDSRLVAFTTYKQIFGNLVIPSDFCVPSNNELWLQSIWGIPLGQIAMELKNMPHKLHPDEYIALKDIGMEFIPVDDVLWNEKVEALMIYQHLNGHLMVPVRYKIPSNDPKWPKSSWNMGLGGIVARLRRDALTVPVDRYKQLEDIGFIWNIDEYTWKRKWSALTTFKELHGHLKVPQVFTVPMHDIKWPKETWGFKLGRAIDKIREYKSSLSKDRIESLTKLGFIWRCRQKRQSKGHVHGIQFHEL